ncbi:HU family DNA-binding protein [Streptomyces sp.]|uniref:HU family DNA-binding protein n=1 Tax=Streptomyces sp. TaxID=1931 RepID=UPI002811EEE8|nr:HU family DNA-binding protein [Streptomyces sp.]
MRRNLRSGRRGDQRLCRYGVGCRRSPGSGAGHSGRARPGRRRRLRDRFGRLQAVHTPARRARNPQTGERVLVPAGRRIVLRPGAAFTAMARGERPGSRRREWCRGRHKPSCRGEGRRPRSSRAG